MLKVKSSPNQNGPNVCGFGVLGVRGFKKVLIFTPKGTSLRGLHVV